MIITVILSLDLLALESNGEKAPSNRISQIRESALLTSLNERRRVSAASFQASQVDAITGSQALQLLPQFNNYPMSHTNFHLHDISPRRVISIHRLQSIRFIDLTLKAGLASRTFGKAGPTIICDLKKKNRFFREWYTTTPSGAPSRENRADRIIITISYKEEFSGV